jgi:hypothetical protein
MTSGCSTSAELIQLIDGELTENRATTVRAHLQGCVACRREADALRALVEDVSRPIEPLPGAVERLMGRLDEAPRVARRARWRGMGAAFAVAAAAVLAVGLRTRTRADLPGTFTARGAVEGPSIERDVGVTVYRGTSHLEALRPGDDVEADAAYSIGYRNLGPDGSAFAAVFAQDARGEIHWIAPVWLDPHADPASESLAHAAREARAPGAIVLDRPAPGDLRVFVVVTTQPLRVSEVEGAGAALDVQGLRRRWPGSVVEETTIHVGVHVRAGSDR